MASAKLPVLVKVGIDYCYCREGGYDRRLSALQTMSAHEELVEYFLVSPAERAEDARYLFESNRHRSYSTPRIRQLVKQYARGRGHCEARLSTPLPAQLITYLTKHSMYKTRKLAAAQRHTTERVWRFTSELARRMWLRSTKRPCEAFPVR